MTEKKMKMQRFKYNWKADQISLV